ncbi:MAG: hypothetical protein GF416_00005, partial [Candidatus Altiarchaeales archaeon]|nr:hypothetical protein [Candidatus Altiarchaeales archaeon]MBD3415503.1 hypothetical protein [Candidatus Altiarchaeales archaeon]
MHVIGRRYLLASLVLIFLLQCVLSLEVPTYISFQGKFANHTSGEAYDPVSVRINITNESSLDQVMWGPHTFNDVTDSQGVFDLVLGSSNELNLTPGWQYQLVLDVDLDAASFSAPDITFGDLDPSGDNILVTGAGPRDASELLRRDNITTVEDALDSAGGGGAGYWVLKDGNITSNESIYNGDVHVEGRLSSGTSQALNTYSVALGGGNLAANGYAFVAGFRNRADIYSSVTGGYDNEARGGVSFIGGGWDNNVSSSASYSAIAGGEKNLVTSDYSFIGGGAQNEVVYGDYSCVSCGYLNTASGKYSAVGGGEDNLANGTWSFVAGYGVNASGRASTGFGYESLSVGDWSFSAGYRANASCATGVALGDQTYVDDCTEGGVSIGSKTVAIGEFAPVAIGFRTYANGGGTAAFGYQANATQYYSFVFGANLENNMNESFWVGWDGAPKLIVNQSGVAFMGELMPDGVVCGSGQVVKSDGDGTWSCQDDADTGGSGSYTLSDYGWYGLNGNITSNASVNNGNVHITGNLSQGTSGYIGQGIGVALGGDNVASGSNSVVLGGTDNTAAGDRAFL